MANPRSQRRVKPDENDNNCRFVEGKIIPLFSFHLSFNPGFISILFPQDSKYIEKTLEIKSKLIKDIAQKVNAPTRPIVQSNIFF